jgi:NADPH-dependent 2,4-dienoyl-CoA reductase/sulfur reductase-like enzyme
MTNRRDFLGRISVAALAPRVPVAARAEDSSSGTASTVPTTSPAGRVVIVGGGMAGAACAKYLRLWGGTGVQVTLVDREPRYNSNIMSNLVLTGQRTMSSLQYAWTTLEQRYGIKRVQGEVLAIDPVNRRVSGTTSSGPFALAYDRLVLAPGIAFETIPGLESAAARAQVLHAWQAGAQTTALRQKLVAMRAGGTFVMTIPKTPYRCPPGPYERACLVADWLRRNRPGSKVLVLDANPDIVAEPHTFRAAFMGVHAGTLEYRTSIAVNSINAAAGILNVSYPDALGRPVTDAIHGDVINAIPPQRAGAIVTDPGLGLAADNRWAAVDVTSYESLVRPGIHVIGDAHKSTQPKAGHIGNQEAKICADAIVRAFRGLAPDPAPMTNSACYSPVTMSTAGWLTAVFARVPGQNAMTVVGGGATESASASSDNYEKMGKWFGTLMTETFQ